MVGGSLSNWFPFPSHIFYLVFTWIACGRVVVILSADSFASLIVSVKLFKRTKFLRNTASALERR